MSGRRALNRAGLMGCCLLCGCSASPPARYYTLSAAAPGAALPIAPTSTSTPVVQLEPIDIPAELDRIEIVSRLGPNRVHIAELDRWAAPLDDQIRRILADDLATRLPPHRLADANEPASAEPRQHLSVSFTDFLGDRRCAVDLKADWTLRGPGGAELRGSEHVKRPGAVDCPGVAAAQMSDALGMLADRLAAVILARSADLADAAP